MLSHAALVNVLKTRYDHYSSPVMAKEILAGAGLQPQDDYGKADIEKLIESVKGLGDARNTNLVARLEEVLGGGPKPAAEPVPVPADEAPIDAPAAAPIDAPAAADSGEATAEPSAESADEKAEDGGDDKADDKAEKKGKKKK
jgi:hypothetical protein